MIRGSLHFFAKRVLTTKCIHETDVHALERVIFSDGIRSRQEVELLLHLARRIRFADPSWESFLVNAIVNFVVWGARPTGYVDQDTARWLTRALSRGGASKLSRRIAREVMTEAHEVDPMLVEFAIGRLRAALRRIRLQQRTAVVSGAFGWLSPAWPQPGAAHAKL